MKAGRIATLFVVAGALLLVAYGLADLVWSVYRSRQDSGIAGHVAWSDVAWGSLPTLVVALALVLAFRLALKDLRR